MDTPSSDGGDFFGRIPLFREFARLLAGPGGPVNWEFARQVALATAAGTETAGLTALPQPVPPVPAGEQARWDEHLRLAELWLGDVTTLGGPPRPSTAHACTRPDWAEHVLRELPPLVEPVARRLADGMGGPGGALPGGPAGLGGMADLGGMAERVGGLLFGAQVGMAVGQLARTVTGQYDLVLATGRHGVVLIVPENVAALRSELHVDEDELRLAVATLQLAHARVVEGVPWLRARLRQLTEESAAAVRPDTDGLAERLRGLDMSDPAQIQQALAGEDLLGRASSPELHAALGRVEALLAVAQGYALVVATAALRDRAPGAARIQELLSRRMSGEDGAGAMFAGLLQARPEQASAHRGASFCRAVLAATDMDGLDRVWADPEMLPGPDELDQPGRWLERAGVVGGEPIDLDEGLRALLDGADPQDGDGQPDDRAP